MGKPGTDLAGRDLDLLMAFRAVAEAGGITAAERRLGIERSVISRQIKSLEDRLGGRLCQRGPRGFELTELGAAVLGEATAVRDLFDRLNSRLAAEADAAGGTLSIAVADNVMTNTAARVPELLRRFVDAAPGCRLTLTVLPPARIFDALNAREAHVGIVGRPYGESDLAFTPFFVEEFRLYAHVPPGEEPPHFADLAARGYGLVVREAERSPPAALRLDLPLTRRVNASGLEAVALLLATGRFVGLLPTHLVAALGDLARLQEVRGAGHLAMVLEFGFVVHSGRYRARVVDLLYRTAASVFGVPLADSSAAAGRSDAARLSPAVLPDVRAATSRRRSAGSPKRGAPQ
jgi:DNA-binding transcriptional LysR family regulator